MCWRPHSLASKFPIIEDGKREVDAPEECNLQHSRPNRLEHLKEVVLMLWDEFLSSDREVFEATQRALNKFQKKDAAGTGDMRQIAPVVIRGDKIDVINNSIPSSPIWQQYYIKKLMANMRLLNTCDAIFK